MSMKTGLFGGSFDPVHLGHKRLADFAVEALGLDKMLIIPAALSPFKESSGADESDRLAMCKAAFPEAHFEVSDIEMRRGGKSYTVDTVSEVKRLYPDSSLYLIIGSDQVLSFNRWYRYKDILGMVTLAGVSREGGIPRDELERFAEKELRPYGRCEILDFSPLEISSTCLREMLLQSRDTGEFLNPAVRDYIDKKGLYKNV